MTHAAVKSKLEFMKSLPASKRADQLMLLIAEYTVWVASTDAVYSNPTEVKKIAELIATFKKN